jgi:hypothetical protein
MKKNLDRRTLGAILGALLGFTYTLFTQTANYIVVPDLPLYSDGNALFRILFGTLTGAFLGFLVNAFSNGVAGVLIGSLLGTAGVVFGGLSRAASTSSEATALVALTLLYTFIPMTVLFMPLSALLRWAAGYYFHEGVGTFGGMVSRWRYLRVILGMIILSVLFGSFVIIPVEGRKMLASMDEYIRDAQASGADNVSTLFKPVVETIQRASSAYSLEWTDDLSKYPSALGSEDAPAQVNSIYNVVFARFESGEKIACIFHLNGSLFICSVLE